MSKIQGLQVLVKQFLSVAADEIVEAVEKIIAGYEEEMFQSKREISRQRKMLDAILQPEIKLNRIAEEAQLNLSVWEEDFQEWDFSLRQKNPESLQTERSHKEPLRSSQDRRPEHNIHDTFTSQCEENEQERAKQERAKVEEEPLPVTSAEKMPIEADEDLPSPGFTEAENDDDKDWRLNDATEDEDGDRFAPQCVENEIDKVEEEPLPVPSPRFSEPENGDDDDWNATQDGDSDRSEELEPSTLTGKTPRMKKRQKSCIICKVCGKDFHSEVSLVKHLESHPKDDCGLCGMHFETEQDFKLHLKTHKNVKAKVCDVCGKCFGKTSHLKEHMMTHTGEKPFKCEVCGKSFTVRSKLTIHLRIHTGERPFTCEVCGKSFSVPAKLTIHLRSHTGERPYLCIICSRRFTDCTGLRKHMREKRHSFT